MATSEERHEMAERLREQAEEGYGVNLESIAYALRLYSDDVECGDEDVFNLLADLIDPTCKILDAHWDDGQCTWGCICSSCDAHLEHKKSEYLRYCPECGMRNVNAN